MSERFLKLNKIYNKIKNPKIIRQKFDTNDINQILDEFYRLLKIHIRSYLNSHFSFYIGFLSNENKEKFIDVLKNEGFYDISPSCELLDISPINWIHPNKKVDIPDKKEMILQAGDIMISPTLTRSIVSNELFNKSQEGLNIPFL